MGGFLGRLIGRTRTEQASGVVEATLFTGDETLEVAGESHYQEALWTIVGGRSSNPIRRSVRALLVPEPTNPYDENAIRVVIDGHTVGYLSREDASVYGPGLLELKRQASGGNVVLEGQIVGGGLREDGIGFLGVFLDHDPTDFGVASRYSSSGDIDLGWSSAMHHDADDANYDLSWSRALSDDDRIAVDQLELLLNDERDPVDRHFMLNFLAARLYRRRDDDPDALRRFDAICELHHSEMSVIRLELLRLFNGLPRVPMYRQAVVRHQKAKQWEQALTWAERGVTFYGNDAIRQENLDDLRKRVAYAQGKLAVPVEKRSASVTRSSPRPNAVRRPQTESLVCAACGSTFERLVARGRKPKLCPSCKSGSAHIART